MLVSFAIFTLSFRNRATNPMKDYQTKESVNRDTQLWLISSFRIRFLCVPLYFTITNGTTALNRRRKESSCAPEIIIHIISGYLIL